MRNKAKLGRAGLAVGALIWSAISFLPTVAAAEKFDSVLERWAAKLDSRAAVVESEAQEPQARVGVGAPLRPGKSGGERVWLMTHRLMELGFLEAGELTPEYSERVADAAKAFQSSVGLKPDGVIGGGTIDALDRSPRVGAVSMRDSAAKLRALRGEHIRDGLFVNLPSQTVTLVRGGEFVLTMRAIVGRPSRETPLLNDRITHIIVNPTWTVPPTVLKEDKLPNLRKSGKTGVSNASVYLDGEEVLDPALVDWSEVAPGRVRIVQQPGNHNALGRFRFNLTNPYSIYLHGTNEPHLFDRDVRTISSGCVRLHDARLLAEILLGDNGVGPDKIERLLATMTPQWIKLAHPMPVRFTYWLSTVDDEGRVRVHPDVYDRSDADEPAGAQAKRTPSPAVRQPS